MSASEICCNGRDAVGPVGGVEPTTDFSCRIGEVQSSFAVAADDRTIDRDWSVS